MPGRECPEGPKDKTCYKVSWTPRSAGSDCTDLFGSQCGQPGHISRDCPSPSLEGGQARGSSAAGGGSQECYKARRLNHWTGRAGANIVYLIVRHGWPHRPQLPGRGQQWIRWHLELQQWWRIRWQLEFQWRLWWGTARPVLLLWRLRTSFPWVHNARAPPLLYQGGPY